MICEEVESLLKTEFQNGEFCKIDLTFSHDEDTIKSAGGVKFIGNGGDVLNVLVGLFNALGVPRNEIGVTLIAEAGAHYLGMKVAQRKDDL